MPDSVYLWIQACEQLKWHNKGSDTCIDTLNRLWRKNVQARHAGGEALLDIPTVRDDMLMVSAEQWSLQKLAAVPRGHARAAPQFFGPVVILDWFERFFLLDGNTRVNFWLAHKNEGPHAVLRISERNI